MPRNACVPTCGKVDIDTGAPPAARSSRFSWPSLSTGTLGSVTAADGARAESASFPQQRFQLVDGHGDPPLSPLGREQAGRVCARLTLAGIDAIYATTLRRTAETAA